MTAEPLDLTVVNARAWLDELYADADPGHWLTLFAQDRTNGTRHVRWATVADRVDLAAQADALAERCCVWFGVATRSERAPDGKRGGSDICAALPGLWLDIDVLGPNHARTDLPPTLDDALDLIDTFPLPPTWIVSTGGGLQPWWMFSDMVDATQATEIRDAWAHTWSTSAARSGWGIDDVYDLARVMRLPGTFNRKHDPVLVEAISNSINRYTLDDLAQYLLEPPVQPRRIVPANATPYIGPPRPGDAFNLSVSCADILARAGWTHDSTDRPSGNQQWRRPGKEKRDGTSATVYADDGHCTIWTSSVPGLDERSAHDPFGLWCRLFHGGDFRKATRAAREMGYGTQAVTFGDWIDFSTRQPVPADEDEPEERITVPPAPEFPLHVLPPVVRDACAMVSAATQTPIDLAAMVALGVLSIVVTSARVVIEVADGWTEGANLYLATALPPGAGKSPVVGALARPLDVLADEVAKAATQARRTHDSEERILKTKLANAEKVMVTGSSDGHRLRDAALLSLMTMDRPPDGKLLVDDITPEAFVKVLWGAGGTIGVLSTEGGLFDQLSRYTRAGQPPNLDGMLKAWSGDTIRVDRVGADAMVVKSPRAAICLTVQPRTVERLFGDTDFTGRGLVARFMLSVPEFAPGWRDLTTPIVIDDAVIGAWGALLEGIYRSHGTAIRYTLAPDARRMFNEWRQELEVGRRLGGPYGDDALREATTKIDSSTVRTALLLHVAERRSSIDPVGTEVMARAIEIGRYWVAQAVRILTMRDVSPIVTDADKLLDWARRQGHRTLTVRVVCRAGVTARRVDGEPEGRDAAHVRVVLDELVHRGSLTFDGVEWHVAD